MSSHLKVVTISLAFILLAQLSAHFIQPPSAAAMASYKATHAELANKQSLTEEEQQRLETQFREINAKDKLQDEFTQIILRNLIIGAILIAGALLAGRKAALENNPVFLTGAIIFTAFIIAQVPAFGAISAATFVITALISGKNHTSRIPSENNHNPT